MTLDFNPPDVETARKLVGRGWWPLLDRVYDMAEEEGVPIFQMKEKFGALRVVWDSPEGESWRTCYDLSRELEEKSLTLCEACGAPGQLRKRNNDWWKTLCDDHLEMREEGHRWEEIFGFQPYTTPMR